MPKPLDGRITLDIAQHLRDVEMLTYDQQGPYLLLQFRYRQSGPLPDNDQQLAAIARVPMDAWTQSMSAALRAIFTVGADGLLHHEAWDLDRAQRLELLAKRVRAGRAGAAATNGVAHAISPGETACAEHLLSMCPANADGDRARNEVGSDDADDLPPITDDPGGEPYSPPVSRSETALAEQVPSTCRSEKTTETIVLNKDSSESLSLSGDVRENPRTERKPKSDPSRGMRLPVDWRPSGDGWQLAREFSLDAERVLAGFRDYWIGVAGAKGRKAGLDGWEATWRNWCRNEADRKGKVKQLPLLTAIQGGQTSAAQAAPAVDPNDSWGIEAWCRSIGAEPANAEALAMRRGKWLYHDRFIDGLAREVARAARFPANWRGDWSLLKAWVIDAMPTQHLVQTISGMAAHFENNSRPATSLHVFDRAVRERRAA